MKVVVIGANGKIGRKVVEQCVARDIPVRAMVRDPGQLVAFEALGAEARLGDLEGDFEAAMEGCDRAIFTAGSGSHTGGDKTLLVDLYGSIRAVEHAERLNMSYFLMISSLKATDPLRGPAKIRHYLVARKLADERLLRASIPHA